MLISNASSISAADLFIFMCTAISVILLGIVIGMALLNCDVAPKEVHTGPGSKLKHLVAVAVKYSSPAGRLKVPRDSPYVYISKSPLLSVVRSYEVK